MKDESKPPSASGAQLGEWLRLDCPQCGYREIQRSTDVKTPRYIPSFDSLIRGWRSRYRGTGGGPAQDILDKCADELEKFVAEFLSDSLSLPARAGHAELSAQQVREVMDLCRVSLGAVKCTNGNCTHEHEEFGFDTERMADRLNALLRASQAGSKVAEGGE